MDKNRRRLGELGIFGQLKIGEGRKGRFGMQHRSVKRIVSWCSSVIVQCETV